VLPPLAVSVVLLPAQMLEVPDMLGVGGEAMLTAIVVCPVQPLVLAVTV